MSDALRALILGTIQGLTEFLPVSSSGHLEIMNHLLGTSQNLDSDFAMVLLVHVGTALSILFVYRHDIWKIVNDTLRLRSTENSELALKIIISMIPALVIGLSFDKEIEQFFEGGIWMVGTALIVTAVVLWFTPRGSNSQNRVGWKHAFLIGMAQAIAILPGISRSGMTIGAALFLGVGREESARFSFLMVLPVILGKAVLDMFSTDLWVVNESLMPFTIAIFSSFIVGIFACTWMIKLVKNVGLKAFALYCAAVGAFALCLNYYG